MKYLKKFWLWFISFIAAIGTIAGMVAVILFTSKKKFSNGLDGIQARKQEKKDNEEAINNTNYNDTNSNGTIK